MQQRLVPVRLFFDYLIEEGGRESNPVGRGRYTPGRRFGGQQRGLVPRLTKLPWIPSAGHRHTDSTLQYIHLSGRDLADKLAAGMQHIHAWRVEMLAGMAGAGASR